MSQVETRIVLARVPHPFIIPVNMGNIWMTRRFRVLCRRRMGRRLRVLRGRRMTRWFRVLCRCRISLPCRTMRRNVTTADSVFLAFSLLRPCAACQKHEDCNRND
jgi:hypothetical protein